MPLLTTLIDSVEKISQETYHQLMCISMQKENNAAKNLQKTC